MPKATEAEIASAKEIIHIKNLGCNVFKNTRVVSTVVNFLNKGKFD